MGFICCSQFWRQQTADYELLVEQPSIGHRETPHFEVLIFKKS